MKKIVCFVIVSVLFMNSHGMSTRGNIVRAIGIGMLLCGQSMSAAPLSANKICDFYRPHIDNGREEVRSIALNYHRGCIQYAHLSEYLSDFRPEIEEVCSVLYAETARYHEKTSGRAKIYYDTLNEISHRLKDQNRTLYSIESFAEKYIASLEQNFVRYIGKDDWYCSDFSSCIYATEKIVDYLSEYRGYHVIFVPELGFKKMKMHLEKEKMVLQALFPTHGLIYKERYVNCRLDNIQNLIQAIAEGEKSATKLYEMINPSVMKRIIEGESSSLWKVGSHVLRNVWYSVVEFATHCFNSLKQKLL
ncbi:MAG: hypothetical protein K6C34_05005 [Alphaproteobacteria bacterium]|nr:hypothetical protein [Alphaproteobacteria bacterium]